MSLKYLGGVLGLVGFLAGPFMLFAGGMGAESERLAVGPTVVMGVLVVAGLAGNVLVLRGTTKVGSVIGFASGLALLALWYTVKSPLPVIPGGLLTIGGALAFFYKEPALVQSQWRIRRTQPPSS